MKTLNRRARPVRFLLLFFVATLLPRSVGAQQMIVSPTAVSAQANVGANAPSQTVTVSKAGKGALRWTVVQPTAGWLSVSPTSGTNNGTLTLTFSTSALAVGSHPTSFRVESPTGSQTVTVQANIVSGPPPPQLTVTCPANISVASPDGSPVVVNYTVNTSGGGAPVTVSGNPASGSSFPVATTPVSVTAQSSDGQTAACTFSVTVTYSPPSGDWTFCASEGGFCAFSGTKQVRYGANGTYFYQTLTGGTACTNSVFGDPIYGTAKHCDIEGTSPPPTLVVTCPANASGVSPDGSPVVVTYSVNTSGGVAPVTVTGSPTSGSSFPVGTTPVQVTAQSSDGQTKSCGFSVTVTYTPPPPSSGVGPQSTITCPSGAINIFPGTNNIYTSVNLYGDGTAFCVKAGVHYLSHSVIPKTGNTFVGEYGAILDGTGWTTTDDSEAAFRAHDQGIDNVTIRNLVIRNLRRGIYGFGETTDHWLIEYNEIASNYSGIVFPAYSTVRNNYIHHNSYGGYVAVYAHNSTLESNEIAYNGWEQKITLSANVTFRNNFVHHNVGTGIWYDSDNTGAVVENNRVEDNGNIGIFYEVSGDGIIRNNIIRRSANAGVMLSVSKNTQIYNNTLENNFRGIAFFLNCSSVGGGAIGFDLADNTAHDNTITVGTQSGAFATVFTYLGSCTPTQVAPYQNGSKNLTFSHNTYHVPSPTTGQYWYFWSGLKYWNEWQAIPQDATGTVSQ